MITLAVDSTQVSFTPDLVYFAFGSGRFRYDCVQCGSGCCRGGDGYFGTSAEIERQVSVRPAVRFFIEPCDSVPHYHATNCAPGCFFLQNDGRCQIQIEQGYRAKPSTCRLFPFNDFRRWGPYLIVLPHSGLCPLQLTAPSERSECSEHDALIASMEMSPIDAHAPLIATSGRDVHGVIALERRITGLADEFTGSGDFVGFAAAQLAIQRNTLASEDAPFRHLAQIRTLIHQVLGIEDAEARRDAQTTDALIAMTPCIRARLLFPPETEPPAGPFPIDILPSFLLALHELLLLARGAGVEVTTYQGAMKLLNGLPALLRMLSVLDRVVVLRHEVIVETSWPGDAESQAAYIRILKSLVRGVQGEDQKTLAQIMLTHVTAEGLERTIFLKRLATRLAGKLTLMSEEASLGARIRNPRASLQQWSLAMASADDVMAANAWRSRQ